MKQLLPIPTKEQPHQCNTYPFHYGQNTKRLMWVEHRSGFGQRLATQTLNPVTKTWFSVKYSLYFDIVVILYPPNSDLNCDLPKALFFNLEYMPPHDMESFRNSLVFDEYQRDFLDSAIAVSKGEPPLMNHYNTADDIIEYNRTHPPAQLDPPNQEITNPLYEKLINGGTNV